jgi:hypothetical protein
MAQEFSFFVFDMKAVTAHMGNREESHSPPLLRCPQGALPVLSPRKFS